MAHLGRTCHHDYITFIIRYIAVKFSSLAQLSNSAFEHLGQLPWLQQAVLLCWTVSGVRWAVHTGWKNKQTFWLLVYVFLYLKMKYDILCSVQWRSNLMFWSLILLSTKGIRVDKRVFCNSGAFHKLPLLIQCHIELHLFFPDCHERLLSYIKLSPAVAFLQQPDEENPDPGRRIRGNTVHSLIYPLEPSW